MKIQIKTAQVAGPAFIGFGVEWDSRHYRAAGITDADFAVIRHRVEWMRLSVSECDFLAGSGN